MFAKHGEKHPELRKIKIGYWDIIGCLFRIVSLLDKVAKQAKNEVT
jgi:hypothetical protein